MACKEQVRDDLVVAAIDFGTSYSGYAFQFISDYSKDSMKIASPQAWNSGKKNYASLKTPTCLLLKESQEEDDEYAFGFEAEERYMDLCMQKKNADYYFFRQFKMQLQDGQGLTKLSKIKDETGKEMLAIDVFALSIKCLKTHLMNLLDKQGTGVTEKDIFWVLTVPAIWNDSAKQFMREAAIKAKIQSEKLAIALEPEAASFFCQHVPVSSYSGRDKLLQFAATPTGTKYMVVDLGGGTADMTVHEKLDGGRLKEISKASGGPWGGTVVDSAFRQLLIKIVGGPVMNKFMMGNKYDFLDLCNDFEAGKRNFDKGKSIIIKLPSTLDKICEEEHKTNFEKCLAESVYSKHIYLIEGKLRIDAKLLETLFRQATDPIVSHMKSILEKDQALNISYILMVGGFSESPFVQQVILEAFDGKNGIKVIIPREAGITIAKGAVIFGRIPHIVESRVLRFTYGVRSSETFIVGKHPEEKRYATDTGLQCKDIFDTILPANSNVKNEDSVTKSYTTVNHFQKEMQLDVYYTKDNNPRYTTDPGCKLLGGLNVYNPNPTKEWFADITFQFGMTELNLSAQERSSKVPCTTKLNMIE